MFSSPMAHYFRHALLAYKEIGKDITEQLLTANKLSRLETALLKLNEKNPEHPKVKLLLEKVRKMKAGLS